MQRIDNLISLMYVKHAVCTANILQLPRRTSDFNDGQSCSSALIVTHGNTPRFTTSVLALPISQDGAAADPLAQVGQLVQTVCTADIDEVINHQVRQVVESVFNAQALLGDTLRFGVGGLVGVLVDANAGIAAGFAEAALAEIALPAAVTSAMPMAAPFIVGGVGVIIISWPMRNSRIKQAIIALLQSWFGGGPTAAGAAAAWLA